MTTDPQTAQANVPPLRSTKTPFAALTHEPPRLALKPAEAARALGIGVRLLWSLTNQGLIPHVRLGKRIIYPVAALNQYLTEQARKAVRP